VFISTAFFDEKPIAVRGEQEHIHFTGAAMLQKERANKALSARVWQEKLGSPAREVRGHQSEGIEPSDQDAGCRAIESRELSQ